MEFVHYDGNLTLSEQEGSRYARNFGAMQYLCRYLGLCDVHAGNYIVRESVPVPTDLESCWIPGVVLGREESGLMFNEERSTFRTNIHEGFKKLTEEEKQRFISQGEEVTCRIMEECPELRFRAMHIRNKARVRIVPIETGTLANIVGSDLQHENVATAIAIIDKLQVAMNERLAALGKNQLFAIAD